MLFNILSVIVVFMISAFIFFGYCMKETPNDDRNMRGSINFGVFVSIIFMWVMSLQNWWR